MIDVNFLKQRVESLSLKEGHGYVEGDRFNQDLASSQTILFEFYYQQFERSQKIVDALLPFLIEVDLTVTGGVAQFPDDYYHKAEMAWRRVVNTSCGTGPDVSEWPIDYMLAGEERYVLSSPIRKPSISKKILRYTIKNDQLYIYPTTITGIKFKYFRKPATATWAFTTVTGAEDFQQYNAGNSVNLEWGGQETENFVDLLLLSQGIQIRDTELIQFARVRAAQ